MCLLACSIRQRAVPAAGLHGGVALCPIAGAAGAPLRLGGVDTSAPGSLRARTPDSFFPKTIRLTDAPVFVENSWQIRPVFDYIGTDRCNERFMLQLFSRSKTSPNKIFKIW